ncbi:MAG TPA: ThiF family adenylyltransferase [Candidatus Sulfotelmatobacter sp.]|nr:ThiF family adenylyltransferase [Candidatus Sulfotelmatobacter sp.]
MAQEPQFAAVASVGTPGTSTEDRYSRQILFRGIGAQGQQKISAASVAIVGCGATGSALAGLLARAGVGTLRIIDRDYVEPSNLQRQSLFDEADAAESLPKAIAAARKIGALNSQVKVQAKVEDLVPGNIEVSLQGMDLILDGTDNFETRYLINDYALKYGIPWVYSAAVGSYGVTLNIVPGESACLACIFPDSPQGMVETCETSGILNSAVNLVASITATEAIKMIVGGVAGGRGRSPESDLDAPKPRDAEVAANARNQIRRTLLSFDVWTNEHAEISAEKPRPSCRACGERKFVHLAGEGRPHITLCGRNSVQIHEQRRPIDFVEMERRLMPHGLVKHNDFVLKFWHDPYEMTLFPDGRAIIKGTSDAAVARSLYARYVGS